MAIGLFISAVMMFYGFLVHIQHWEGTASVILEIVCFYGGLAGIIYFSIKMYLDYKQEKRFMTQYRKREHVKNPFENL